MMVCTGYIAFRLMVLSRIGTSRGKCGADRHLGREDKGQLKAVPDYGRGELVSLSDAIWWKALAMGLSL